VAITSSYRFRSQGPFHYRAIAGTAGAGGSAKSVNLALPIGVSGLDTTLSTDSRAIVGTLIAGRRRSTMKRIVLLLLGLLLGASSLLAQPGARRAARARARAGAARQAVADAGGKKLLHLNVDGKEREFIVYQPARIANVASPVVFVFHGTGGSGEVAYEKFGWKEKADAEGIVTVFPSALRYHIFDDELVVKGGEVKQNVSQFTTKWNFYGLQRLLDPKYTQTLYDDVKFVRAMVDTLKQSYKVDTSRFYATGFSNGAQFTGRLLVEMTDVFAAYAACSAPGAVPASVATQANETPNSPFRPRPLMHVFGELDPKLTHAVGVTAFPMDESAVAPGTAVKEKVINNLLLLLRLTDKYTYQRTNRVSAFHYTQPATTGAAPEYVFAIVKGMKHVYPNGKNYPLKAVDQFWPFFQKYRR
jgi:polyhydroxybutyrate depolymerase